MSLVSLLGMRRLGGAMHARAASDHPVSRLLPVFATHMAAVSELRLQRLGLLDRPLSEVPRARRVRLVAEGLTARALAPILPARRRRLTSTYLLDPALAAPGRRSS